MHIALLKVLLGGGQTLKDMQLRLACPSSCFNMCVGWGLQHMISTGQLHHRHAACSAITCGSPLLSVCEDEAGTLEHYSAPDKAIWLISTGSISY